MVMGLCLLVYSWGQKGAASSSRAGETNHQQSVGQADCQSHNAVGVSMLYVNSHFLGAPCQKYYLLT